MTWYFILLAIAVVTLVAVVWRRQTRHPVDPARRREWESRIEGHHTSWGNGASTRK